MRRIASKKRIFSPKIIITAAVLFLVTLMAQLANQWYLAAKNHASISEFLLPSLIFLSVLTLPSIWIGVALGSKLGLGIIQNQPPLATHSQDSGIGFSIATGLLLGAFLLILRWILTPYLPAEIPEYGFRGPIGGLLVSLGAAIGEEVWFRFGLMTLLLFITKKLFELKEDSSKQLSNKSAMMVILIVAFGFGLAHLPQLNSFGAGTHFAIWATILGNVAVSTLFGWCYWRYGLLASITAHFSVDIVLHVLPAFMN